MAIIIGLIVFFLFLVGVAGVVLIPAMLAGGKQTKKNAYAICERHKDGETILTKEINRTIDSLHSLCEDEEGRELVKRLREIRDHDVSVIDRQ